MYLPVSFVASAALASAGRIELDASRRSPAVSRNLFGKFTEHLGRNVYQGMWAQIVVNPEFTPASRWENPEVLRRRLEHAEAHFGLEGVRDAPGGGLAAFWTGDGVETSIATDGRKDVQRLRVVAEGGSIATGIYLPLHRVATYDLTLTARAERPTSVRATLERTDGDVFGGVVLDIGTERESPTVRIEAQGDFEIGDPYVLRLWFEPGATLELDRIVLFPSDHVEGWEPEVVDYMRAARLPMLRFPGGNFVSGYHWEDGVGSLDARPALANPAWPEVEFNHVGTDEWLRLCELVGCEPLICINAGNGTPDEARRWVAYCNDAPDSPMGRLRASNGHPEPYDVRYWEVGNELYGGWQIGHTTAEGYATRYVDYANAMLSADATIRLIANGDTAEWNRTLVAGAAVRSISVHSLPGSHIPGDADPEAVFLEYMAHADGYADYLGSLAKPMVDAGLTPLLAVTELQIFTNKPSVPNNGTLSETLWVAGIIHSCVRSGVVELLTHSAMLNHGGGLRKERSVVYTNPVWWTTHLYGSQSGTVPTATRVECGTFTNDGRWLGQREKAPDLDALALLNDEGDEWSLFVVNRHPTETYDVEIALKGFEAGAEAEVAVVAGERFVSRFDGLATSLFMAVNTWERPALVTATYDRVAVAGSTVQHRFPACSLTRLMFRRR
jgi:alpha-N-arabinofuranosidase